MADFVVDVTAWVERAQALADRAFRAIAEGAVDRVKELTPVRTGYLRSNWTAILAGEREPVEGSVPDASAAINRAVVGQTIVVLNPVRYARRVEYGFVGVDARGRRYNQVGRGMVQQTVAEMPEIARRALVRLGVLR